MSEFKELIKSFPKVRDYVRDFFIYGFKTRDEFTNKSTRTYDNERRRIESWLSDFISHDYTSKGKNISLAIDSNLLDTNPLYRVWKTKSFTDNDIMLHFFLLDFLSPDNGKSIEEITDGILDTYGVYFDSQLIRRKCNSYVKEGLLKKEKYQKELHYLKNGNFQKIRNQFPLLEAAIQYFHLTSPLGIIGDTILDNLEIKNTLFRVKHSFFVHTLEDEVLSDILTAIRKQSAIRILIKSSRQQTDLTQTNIPLQIFSSTRTGRRFLCLYSTTHKDFYCVRMDSIKKVEILDIVENYAQLREMLKKNHEFLWGVSFQNQNRTHKETVKLTLFIEEKTEGYLLKRLQREGKGGSITKIKKNTYLYEKEVFDSNEMLPWIRTFTGRILKIECSSKKLEQLFYQDMKKMYQMYQIES